MKKEIRYALQLLYYLFKEESFNKVNSYIKLIKLNWINFPNFIREYIEKTFIPNYKSYLYYLKKLYKNKWDDTNNKTEGYFRATMSKCQKNTILLRPNQSNLSWRQWFDKKSTKKEKPKSKRGIHY